MRQAPLKLCAALFLAVVISGTVGVEHAAAVTCSSGAAAQNGVTVVPSHGTVFYIDTGVNPVLDAGYVGYRVTNSTGSTQTDLWTQVSNFTGGKLTLANSADSMMKVATLANGATGTSYFMLKATSSSTSAQTHTLKVYTKRPDLAGAAVLYQCDFSFAKVKETIKAAANKLADNGFGTSATIEVDDSSPELGQLVTITVEGQTGQIGAGSTPDFDIIWLTPAAVSTWPTRVLRLETVSVTFDANNNWNGPGDETTFTNQLLITGADGLTNVDQSGYRASYGFRVVGRPTATVKAVPIAQIASGTQVKHTDTGAAGGTLDLSFSALTINAALSKSITQTTGLTTVNCSGACAVPGGAGNGTYVEVPYRLTASSTTATVLTIDEFVDQVPTGVIFKPGSATITDIGRTNVAVADPIAVATDPTPKPLHFVGPFTLNNGTSATLNYKVYIPVGSFANTAYAKIGDFLVGATTSAMSRITVTSNGTSTVGVVVDTVNFSINAVTDPVTSITTTSATLNGTVDPNGTSVLIGQFEYGTSPTLAGSTTTTATTPASGNLGGLTDPTAVSLNLTGLSNGTTYYYRVIAGSAQGSILSFTTLGVTAPPVSTTLAASPITSTTATLNGTINPHLTPVTGVQFIYGTSSTLASGNTTATQDDGTDLAALTINGTTDQAFTQALTGLTAGTTYYFKIRACTSALTGTYPAVTCTSFVDGSILSFLAANPPTATTNAATSVSTNSATLNGTINANGASTTTSFTYSTVSDLSSGTTTIAAATVTGASPTAVSAAISGLTANTTYYFRVQGTNSSGSATGSILNFTTVALIPNLSTSTKVENDADNIVIPGQVITYTVTIINTGNTTGTGISVTDTIDTDLQSLGSFTFSNCGVPTNSSTSTAVNVTNVSVTTASNCVITFQTTVKTPRNEGTAITNTATISAATQGGPGASPSSSTLTIDATPILSTSTLVDNDTDNFVSRSQTVTYTLTIKNTGNGQATGVNATTATINSNIQTLSVTGTTNCGIPTNSSTSTALNVTGIAIQVGTDCVITYTVQVTPGATPNATIPMSATASAATEGGSGASPSADTLTVIVPPDLSTSTKADNDGDNFVTPGQVVTYTITVINNGGTTGTGVSVTDTIDTDLQNLGNFTFTGCGVPTNSSTVTAVNITGISVTTAVNCVITYQASVKTPRNEGVTVTNTATISAAAEGGPGATPSSDVLTVDATPVLTTSTLTDNDADNFVNRSQTVTYTLTIKNTGNGQASGIAATTTIDTSLQTLIVTGTTNCGTPTNSSTSTALSVTSITVQVGTNCVITYTAQVKPAATPAATIPMSVTLSAASEGGSGATPAADTLTVYVPPDFSTSTKTANDGDNIVFPGQVLTYTINVINTGSTTGTGVSIADIADSDLENLTNITASNCGPFINTSTSTSLNLSFVSIASAQNCVVTFQVTVKPATLAGQTIVNTATISTAIEGGTGGSPSAPTLTVQTIPDLSTSTKSDNDADNIVSPLQVVSYIITVKNTGVGTGTAISVTDTLDTDLDTLTNVAFSNCGSGPAPTNSSIGTALNVSNIRVTTVANCVITYDATVKASATTGSTIPNTATISAAFEGGTGASPSSDVLTVDATPNLSTSTKTEDDADNIVTPGQTVTYTITIPNTGTGAGTLISVTDTLDTRLQSLLVTGTTNCGTPTNSSTSTALNVTGVSIAAAASCVITFTAQVKPTAQFGDVIFNTATISVAFEGGTGASPSSSNLTVQYVPNLSTSTKADNDADNIVTPGQVITYTVTLINSGVGTGTGVSVSDTLDTDLENLGNFTFANCGVPSNSSTSTVVNITGISVTTSTNCVITFKANVKTPRNEGATVTNTAIISAATEGGSGASPSSDTLTVNATPTLTTSTLTDNDADNFVNRSQTVTYTLTIKNTGDGQGSGITATTTIDTSLQNLLVTGTTNCGSPTNSSTSTVLSVTGIAVAVGTNCVITYTAQVKPAATANATIPMSVTVSAATEGGAGASPAADTLTVFVSPDLSTSIKADNDGDNLVDPGQNITYTLTLINTGGTTASGVSVTDTIDTDLENLGTFTFTNCGVVTNSSTSTAVNVTGITVTTSTNCVISFHASVKNPAADGAVINNTAIISAAAEGGPGASLSSDVLNLNVVPDLSTSTKADNDVDNIVTPGQDITYTVTIINTGTGTGTGIAVTDTLDTDLQNLNTVGFSNCGSPTNSSTSTVLNVTGISTSITTNCVITFHASVKTPRNEGTNIGNTAVISASAQGGPGASPSSDTLTVDATPNLSTSTKSENDADNIVAPGQDIIYTITLKNTGNGDASGVSVTDALDSDLENLASVGFSNCGSPTNNSTSTALNVTGIAVTTTADCIITFHASVKVTSPFGAIASNTATISSSSEGGPGASPAASDLTVQFTPNFSTSTKADNDVDNSVIPGQRITFTVTVKNTGNGDASGVSVTDTLDTDLQSLTNVGFLNCGSPTDNSTSTALSVSTVGVVVGTDCVITFQASVKNPRNQGTVITNTAIISAAAEGGPGASPSSDTLTVDATPDLSTSTKVDNDADNIVTPGQAITYTVTLINTGDGDASGVSVTDIIDTDLQNLTSVTTSSCGSPTNSSTSTALNVTGVAVTTTANCVITFQATVKTPRNEGTLVTNTATISAATEGGVGAGPSASTLTVDATPNFSTSTKADDDADDIVTPLQDVIYTVTLKNTGDGQATGVSVTDTIDTDLQNLTSVTMSAGCGSPTNSSTATALNVTSVTVQVGTDCVITFKATVKATVTSLSTVTNTATVSAATEGGVGGSPSSPTLAVAVSGSTSSPPSNSSVKINNDDICTVSGDVTLKLQATDANAVIVSNDPIFVGASWEPFTGSPMLKPWTLAPGDGSRAVYAMFKKNNAQAPSVSDSITVDVTNQCGTPAPPPPPSAPPPPPPSAPPPPPPSAPLPPPPAQCTADCANVSYDLYIVNPDGTERHMNDPRFARIQRLSATVASIAFEDKGNDMDFDDVIVRVDRTDCTRILATAVSVDAAWQHNVRMTLYYKGVAIRDLLIWPDSHQGVGTYARINANEGDVICLGAPLALEVQLPPTTPYRDPRFTTGLPPFDPGPVIVPPQTDFSGAAYDLYIVNPDGTERHMNDPRFAHIEAVSSTVTIVRFEDKGSDFDYNDVVLRVDTSDWTRVVVTAISIDAGWQHNVRMTFFNYGNAVGDLLIWPDSHQGVGQYALIDANAGGAFIVGRSVAPIAPGAPYINPLTGVIPPLPPTTSVPPASVKAPTIPAQQCNVSCDDVGYDLYIVNPDGTERHMGSNYVHTTTRVDGKLLVGFEDSGADFDYNDVVALIDKKDCSAVTFEMLALSANWHHKVILDVFYKGQRKFDAIIWPDSHAAAGNTRTVNAKDAPAMCMEQTPTSPAPTPSSSACSLTAAFLANIIPDAVGLDVVRLQNLLKCLGFFPADVVATGHYGPITRAAVVSYQNKNGIDPVGSVGPVTRASLNRYAAR